MKRLLLCALLGGLSLAAPAQTTEPGTEVRIRGYQIELPVHRHIMFRSEFDEYAGAYSLSNGETLTLTRNDRRMYGQVGMGPRKELVAARANQFVALDREMKITIERDDRTGDVGGEVLMVVDRDLALGNPGQIVRLASVR